MQPNGLPQHCGFLLLFLVSSDEMCVDSLSLSEGVCLRVLLILEYQLSERQRVRALLFAWTSIFSTSLNNQEVQRSSLPP